VLPLPRHAAANRPGRGAVAARSIAAGTSARLSDLARYGITADDVAAAGCYAYDLAAWRIRGHLKKDKGDLWTRAANYHSRTPRYNTVYRKDLRVKAARLAD
jgi:hypothetical protein